MNDFTQMLINMNSYNKTTHNAILGSVKIYGSEEHH